MLRDGYGVLAVLAILMLMVVVFGGSGRGKDIQ